MLFKHKRLVDSDKATKTEPQHAPSAHSLESDLTASQQRVLAMQQTQGNRAVLRMFATSRGAVAQREPQVGWNTRGGKVTTGPNKGETDIPVDTTDPTLGSARRIPVRSLGHGSTLDDPGGLDWKDQTVSSQTQETASEKQAIVVIPDNLDVKQAVGVLLHLQGLTIGYRNSGGKVEDVDFARIEQQLRASGKNMIAILPQAALPDTARRSPNFGNVYRDNLIDDVFKFLTDQKLWTKTQTSEAVRPDRGPLVYSAYSGGGFAATNILENDITGSSAKTGDINPAKMGEVILFDCIHNDDQIRQVKNWLKAQINHDLSKLNEVADTYKDPKQREAKQREYLVSSMRFRGIFSHTDKDFYRKKYDKIKDALDDWFGSDAEGALKISPAKIMSPAVVGVLRANYQVIDTGHDDHKTVISQGDPLKNALLDLPAIGSTTAKQTTGTVKSSGVVPGAGSTASGTANVQKKTLIDRSIQRQPAPNGSGNTGTAGGQSAATPEQALTDAAIQLAESGATRMQPDYIRQRLQNRSGDAALSSEFNQLVMVIIAQQAMPMGSPLALVAAAQDLIKFLETQFINDPNASTLDFLARGQSYRSRRWHRLDYPGHAEGEAEGPNEDEAARMIRDLGAIEPERRPNTGGTAVVTLSEFTGSSQLRAYITAKLQSVPNLPAVQGQPAPPAQTDQRLNETALQDFLRMRQDASKDGVELIIVDGYRPPSVSQEMSQGQNPNAIASYSSHNLGLAMDLQMSHGRQQFEETTTRPMQNVVDMHQSPAHKWMFLHGPDYGWFPWHSEPWHWEYNPSGFRDRFQTDFQTWAAAHPARGSRRQ